MDSNTITKIKISLIIPAYNEEKYIGACLESVALHGVDIFEVIVVDNASTDRTSEIVKHFPDVKFISEPAKGVNKARQRGLLESTGDIIAYMDADTKMPQNWVNTLTTIFTKHPEVVCLSGPYIYYDASWLTSFAVRIFWLFAYATSFFTGYMGVGGNLVARKSALMEIGGFDTTIDFYGDDTDISRRLAKVGKVRFMLGFYMYSSARRLEKEGLAGAAGRYILNFLSIVFRKKPFHDEHVDIR